MLYRQRLFLLFSVIGLFCFVAVPVRLFELQILSGDRYHELAEDRRVRQDPTEGVRGEIRDRHGVLLAHDEPTYDLQVVLREVRDRDELLARLASILHQPEASLAGRWERYRKEFVEARLRDAPASAAASVSLGSFRFRWMEKIPFSAVGFKPPLPPGVSLQPRTERRWGLWKRPGSAADLWIDFRSATTSEGLARDVAESLGLDVEVLSSALAQVREKMDARVLRSSPPLTLQEDLSLEQAIRMGALDPEFPGIEIRARTVRRYPQGVLLGQVVGSVGRPSDEQLRSWLRDTDDPVLLAWADRGSPPSSRANFYLALHRALARKKLKPDDLVGRTGIEATFEDSLRGRRGEQIVERDARNRVQEVLGEYPSQAGHDVFLSLDAELQGRVERAFDRAAGAAVFMDVRTGEILAAASFPRFDPNELVPPVSAETAARLFQSSGCTLNRVCSSYYPLGSIFKLVTSVALLEERVLTAETTIRCRGPLDPGQPNVFRCWHRYGHGELTLPEAIQRSCNVFFYTGADRLPPSALIQWGQEFEFGVRPGSELRNFESAGLLPSPAWKEERFGEPWYAGDSRNLAIGQGQLLVNPLQVVRMVAALANGGILLPVRFVHRVVAEDGSAVDFLRDVPHRPARQLPISRSTLDVIRRGMIAVANSPAGTAYHALASSSLPYRIAGKTSTAQTGAADGNVGWFAGYAPADDPDVAFAVVVEGLRPNSRGAEAEEHGGDVAAPIIRRILEQWPVPFGRDP
ncbi:MAG: hypothetical protein HYU36_07770 [Planctomycetes bacterium]|nr:hypothetical protein [Planctomycetota bacterium]